MSRRRLKGGTGSPGDNGAPGADARLTVWLSAALTLLRGKKVVAKLSVTRRTAGRGSLTWNGKIKRKLAPRGAYKILLRAVSPTGASASDAAAVRIR